MEDNEVAGKQNVTERLGTISSSPTIKTTPRTSNSKNEQYKSRGSSLQKIRNAMTSLSMFTSPNRNKPVNSSRNPTPANFAGVIENDEDDTDMYLAPTKLHKACYSASSLDDLRDQITSSYPSNMQLSSDLNKTDNNGCNPLHLLALNKKLAHSVSKHRKNSHDEVTIRDIDGSSGNDGFSGNAMLNKKKAVLLTDFCLNALIVKNPFILSEEDDHGFLPFEQTLLQFIEDLHQQVEREMETLTSKRGHLYKIVPSCDSPGPSIPATLASPSSHDFEQSQASMIGSRSPDISYNKIENVSEKKEKIRNYPVKSTNEVLRHDVFPSALYLPVHIEYILHFLSVILNYLDEAIEGKNDGMAATLTEGERSGGPSLVSSSRSLTDNAWGWGSLVRRTSNASDIIDEGPEIGIDFTEIRSTILIGFASIPELMKTFILVDNSRRDRDRILEYSIVQGILLEKESLGQWLTSMIQNHSRGIVECAVDYLHILSLQCDAKGMRDQMEEFYDELYNLDLIPSMLSLDIKMVEKASTTSVVGSVLDKMITTPFSVSLIFCDLLFLLLLIFSFQTAVGHFFLDDKGHSFITWIYVTNSFMFYFVLREIGKNLALQAIMKRRLALQNLHFQVWWMVDIISVIMTIICSCLMRVIYKKFDLDNDDYWYMQILLAITTLLLWLKFLGMMKTINMKLATFILAIIEITKDVKWYIMIIGTFVLSFAQFFYILLIPENCQGTRVSSPTTSLLSSVAPNSSPLEDVNDCKQRDYYIKIYTILLGDTDLFGEDHGTLGLLTLVFFSFLLVIMLLNVLIAIVGDSYEKCMIGSKRLFARARVLLLAELISFQNMFKNDHNRKGCIKWKRGGLAFTVGAAVCTIVWVVAEYYLYENFDEKEGYGSYNYCLIIICIYVGLLTIFLIALTRKSNNNSFYSFSRPIQNIMISILGMTVDPRDSKISEWKGRVLFLRKELSQKIDETSKETWKLMESELTHCNTRTKEKIYSLEKRIKQSEKNILTEMKASEDRIKRMLDDFMESVTSH